ncbi:MAG: pyridoxal-dependent decarboxylase, exosortase A system-associated [Burkholderiales bacterium]|nr:pyridoxal-dependent decarboxylase, exosortase A system-associated [Burkholderiales bacterium]
MIPNKPVHFSVNAFPVIDDCLQIGGMPLTRLAKRAGGAFFAYDRRLLTERVDHVKKNLPPEVALHYAMKANPMPALVQHMATLVDGLDVASRGELNVALDTPLASEHISFAGPGKTGDDLESAIAAGIVINLESVQEMENAARIGQSLGYRPKVAVRVNPDFELKSSGMKMGGGAKQFGVDAEQVPKMLERMAELDFEFVGFHIFSGSQNLKAEAIMEAQEKSIMLGLDLSRHAPSPVRVLNIGGGFGIPYFPGETPLDLAAVGDNLGRLMPMVKRDFPGACLVIELGRYLVGEAGIYVTRVIDRKISRGQIFLVTEGGLHHHLAASGNFGQVIRKNYPVAVGNKMQGSAREVVSVVGPLCTPLDLLADRMEMAQADVGDFIVVFQSGAYGPTASPSAFLSHPKAVEVLV